MVLAADMYHYMHLILYAVGEARGGGGGANQGCGSVRLIYTDLDLDPAFPKSCEKASVSLMRK